MEVKIYREPENEVLIMDDELLSRYNELVSELGIQKTEVAKDICPNVYICLNTAMNKQLRAICPDSSEATNYHRSTIPVQVLDAFKYAKDNNMFDKFEIWFDNVKPDPLLIGKKFPSEEAKVKGYTWNMDCYLIARWGDCALELPELLQLGYNRLKQTLIDQTTEAITSANAILANPDLYVRKSLSNNMSSITISI